MNLDQALGEASASQSDIIKLPASQPNNNIIDSSTEPAAEVLGQADDESHGIRFNDWGFRIDRLFEVAHRFYKRNESKAFHPSFDIRNQMNALILQAKYGNFNEEKTPDVGVLDLIGKSRRNEWAQLKGTSKTEAMSKFICTLDELCPFFKAYAEAVKISYGSQLSNNGNHDLHQSDSPDSRSISDEIESDDQLKAIHMSLCRQTYSQFKNYANKQYPHDPDKQKYLIKTLQEQYFKQYISQMQPNDSNEKVPSPKVDKTPTGSEVNNSKETEIVDGVVKSASLEIAETAIDIGCAQSSRDELDSETCGSPLQHSISYDPLEPASIWTKRGVREFKYSLEDDKHGGSYVVRQGVLLTIQVPTFPDGRYIHWEFCTDDHDIGFGLDFLYDDNIEKPYTLRFLEEEDDDDDDDDEEEDDVRAQGKYEDAVELGDEESTLDGVTTRKLANGGYNKDLEANTRNYAIGGGEKTLSNRELRHRMKMEKLANTATIVPTYRRDSHEEVFVGRHKYPSQGYYLLKFDNTYSVLRSKSLHFRICYFV